MRRLPQGRTLYVDQTWAGISVTDNKRADQPPGDWHPPRIAGLPADQRLLHAAPELVESVLAALGQQVPMYRRLPPEQLAGDITRVIERSIRSFGQVLRTGHPTAEGELAAVRDSAARRAEEGVPLDAVLTAYHLGVRICWEAVVGGAGPQDTADLLTADRLLLDFLREITAATAAGYFEQRQTMTDDQHAARHALLSALLDGAPAEEPAARAGLRLPPGYVALSLAFADHPDEAAPGVGAIAGRRKLRRLRAELDHRTRSSALSVLSASGGIALIPCTTHPDDLAADDWRQLAELVDGIARAAGVEVLAGAAPAEPAGVAAAASLAREVREVARTFGRPPGLYRIDDLLLEYQLSRPGRARRQLAALLGPLDGNTELLTTLRTHLAAGLNRQHTARALHLHPNTVDYRLRRVAALTGLDAGRPDDLLRISAALAARDADEG